MNGISQIQIAIENIKANFCPSIFIFIVVICFNAMGESVSQNQYSDFERDLIKKNIFLSDQIDSFAEAIDLFITGKKVTKKKNPTSVVVNQSVYHSEGKSIGNGADVSLNLRFPNLEEYWQLQFSNYDEAEENRGVKKTYFRQLNRKESVGASFGVNRKLGKVKTSFTPRLRLENPLHISYTARLEIENRISEGQLNAKLELFAHPKKGTGVFIAFPFYYPLHNNWGFNLNNEAEYQDGENLFSTSNGIGVSYSFSDRTALSNSFTLFSNNSEKFHLQSYVYGFSFVHIFYKKILEGRVVPFLDFNKNGNFKGRAGIQMNLILQF